MEITLTEKRLCFVGDIHGEFGELGFNISRLKFEDTAFILLGDCGIGFGSEGWVKSVYTRKLRRRLEDRGNHLYLFRGNHDDPDYYKEEGLGENLPSLTYLSDYSRLTWGNREILVIGGGISVDQEWRKEEEKKTSKKLWWPGEGIIHDLECIKNKEDIILSHMAPLCVGPILTRDDNLPHEIWSSERSDREYLTDVIKKSRPSRWYFGHYHTSCSGDYEDCMWRGLGIQEIVELYD